MSTDRSRALAYAAKITSRKRREQPKVFNVPTITHRGPAFMENPRDLTDPNTDKAKAIRAEVDKLESKEYKDEADSKSFEPGKEASNALVPHKTTANSSQPEEIKSAFVKAWTISCHIPLPIFTHPEKSFYTPIINNLFEVLFESEATLCGSEQLKFSSQNYFSLPIRLYYAVIVHVQILRAQEQAGVISKKGGAWLRSFWRRYKDTQCTIAGPLVPFFYNLTCFLPDDSQFDYVYPTFKETGTYTSKSSEDDAKSTITVDSSHLILPSVTMLTDMFKQFCTMDRVTDSNFDEDGYYVPFQLSKGGLLGGVNFPAQTQSAPLGNTFVQLLHNPAFLRPLPESKERLKEIHSFYKRQRSKRIPTINPKEFVPTNVDEYLNMGDSIDWFEICINQAALFTQFFSDSVNLSNIPTLGNQSTSIQTEIYMDKFDNTPTSIPSWYPDTFSGLKIKLRSSNSEITPDHIYNSAYCLTNGKLMWTDIDGKKIGSKASGLRGGPYWENSKYNYMLEYPFDANKGIRTMIQTQFYIATAHLNN